LGGELGRALLVPERPGRLQRLSEAFRARVGWWKCVITLSIAPRAFYGPLAVFWRPSGGRMVFTPPIDPTVPIDPEGRTPVRRTPVRFATRRDERRVVTERYG